MYRAAQQSTLTNRGSLAQIRGLLKKEEKRKKFSRADVKKVNSTAVDTSRGFAQLSVKHPSLCD